MPAPAGHWHGSKCPGPRIEFEEHEPNCEIKDTCHLLTQCRIVPHCVACGRKPLLHDIISEHDNSSTFIAIPQDKPFGHMNLYWPSRSWYHGSTDLVTSDKAKHEQALSGIYPTTLLPGQFRQALLSPTGGANFKHTGPIAIDPGFPVHLTLEMYEDDNCPEYEAFSYTWAGEHPEDEGQHLCRPVYIGSSWDVLRQTRNCWELLRFARLFQVTRHVWVDALCINQGNTEEKAQQVAKMGRIYRDSLRVVVYLGPDVAVKPNHRFSRRCHFGQFASSGVRPKDTNGSPMAFDIERLFRRRYFTRLWVIQELILSSKAIIHIGDIDISVDPIITKRLENTPGWDWAKTSAAWFKYVSRQTLGRDPCGALQLVSNASCSDLRDRLFGILGLMNPEDIVDRGVQADYSLSSQHVWIGFFAHCMLRLDIFWFLEYTVGLHTSSESQTLESWVPNWVPNWTSLLTWQRFQRPTLSCEEMADATRRALATEEPYKNSTAFVRTEPDIKWLIPINPNIESRTLWNQGAALDAKTRALSHVQAIYLFAIPSTPQLWTRLGDYGVYEIDLLSMHWRNGAKWPEKRLRHHML
ncbi:heterokaryon incompatibility protein-domain-containing protein [Xylaria castorea]|nr:heterokaryon incompatibility protein-domain-containing protein [Xylaria castorea]